MSSISSLPERLRAARQALGLSTRALDRKAGLSNGQTSRIEGGKRPRVEAETIEKLAAALGVTTEWLLGGNATPRAKAVEHGVDTLPHRQEAMQMAAKAGFNPRTIVAMLALDDPESFKADTAWWLEQIVLADRDSQRGGRVQFDADADRHAATIAKCVRQYSDLKSEIAALEERIRTNDIELGDRKRLERLSMMRDQQAVLLRAMATQLSEYAGIMGRLAALYGSKPEETT